MRASSKEQEAHFVTHRPQTRMASRACEDRHQGNRTRFGKEHHPAELLLHLHGHKEEDGRSTCLVMVKQSMSRQRRASQSRRRWSDSCTGPLHFSGRFREGDQILRSAEIRLTGAGQRESNGLVGMMTHQTLGHK